MPYERKACVQKVRRTRERSRSSRAQISHMGAQRATFSRAEVGGGGDSDRRQGDAGGRHEIC